MKPLTREQLESMKCSNPDCDHTGHDAAMVLASRCHRQGVKVVYSEGVIAISCQVCDAPIVLVAVASEGDPNQPVENRRRHFLGGAL